MALKPVLPFLEIMLTQVCNLSCAGCSTYSDYAHRGYEDWSQTQHWLKQWLELIAVEDIGFMGGEPLINPHVLTWLEGVRELLPNSRMRFPTNGLLLERNWHVVEWLYQDGNAVLKITNHTDGAVLNVIDRLRNSYDWKPIHEYGIDRWITDTGLRLQINRPEKFSQTFQGTYTTMQPWRSDPDLAYANCHQQTCPMLWKERIYKCSTSALTSEAWQAHGRPNAELWAEYFDHEQNGSIALDSSIDQLHAFASNFGKPHATCRQCPTVGQSTVDHRHLVQFR
jgi:organic radical activating enzyme